ncbi:hypothetical protein Nmel_018752 [Mimus melanotis]
MPGVPDVPVTSRVLEGAAMAAAPHPAPHLQQHLEQSPEQRRAADIIRLLTLYRPLLDAFVIDFFTEGLWAQLPPAWQPALASATPAQLAGLLRGREGPGAAWPLSLLAFATAARALAFPRGCPGGSPRPPCQSSHLHPLLRRHVKPKKQHEIQRLSKLLQRLSQATSCERVVDIGAGQVRAEGHGGDSGDSPPPELSLCPPPRAPFPGSWPLAGAGRSLQGTVMAAWWAWLSALTRSCCGSWGKRRGWDTRGPPSTP